MGHMIRPVLVLVLVLALVLALVLVLGPVSTAALPCVCCWHNTSCPLQPRCAGSRAWSTCCFRSATTVPAQTAPQQSHQPGPRHVAATATAVLLAVLRHRSPSRRTVGPAQSLGYQLRDCTARRCSWWWGNDRLTASTTVPPQPLAAVLVAVRVVRRWRTHCWPWPVSWTMATVMQRQGIATGQADQPAQGTRGRPRTHCSTCGSTSSRSWPASAC